MQETALPHRVVRSAKDLAYATLSGTSELNDPRGSKQAGTSTQASHYRESKSSGIAPCRPNLKPRENSFRENLSAITHRQAEEDFDQFQRLNEFQEQQHLEFADNLAFLRDACVPQGSKFASQHVSHMPHGYEPDTTVQGHTTSTNNIKKSISRPDLTTGSVCKTNADLARVAAIQRLHLIGAHLQKNAAMQVLQHNVHDQAHASMHEMLSHVQNEYIQQDFHETRAPVHEHKVQSERDVTQEYASPQHHESLTRDERPCVSSPEEEENVPQRQFHCPYYACHRNLQIVSANGSSSSQKPCVHIGCEFQADKLDSWVEHIHVPHHDLLGSF